MGMLDDAIREHLELKKRSGADEDEVRRLEVEAFGANRPAQPPAPPAAEPEAEPEPEPVALEPEPEPEPVVPVAPPPPPPTPAPAPRAAEEWLEDEPAAEEYVEPDAEEGDDLLEETPDFLQETPEHDRLWFEQKPPRDFEFDE